MKLKLTILFIFLISTTLPSYAAKNPLHSYGCKIKEELIAEKLQLIARHDVNQKGILSATMDNQHQCALEILCDGKVISKNDDNIDSNSDEYEYGSPQYDPPPLCEGITLDQADVIACEKRDGSMRHTGILQVGGEVTTTSEETEMTGTVEGFILPGKKSVFTVPIVNLSFTLNENDIVYVCFHLDDEEKENNHLTLFFLEGNHIRPSNWNFFNLKPTVKMSPATIEIQTIEGTVDKIGDILGNIFKGIPVISMIVKLFGSGIHFIMDNIHKLLDHIIGIGVTKVFITGEKLELYYGMELLDQTVFSVKQKVSKINPLVDGQSLDKDQ
jgi:hypothetical protein